MKDSWILFVTNNKGQYGFACKRLQWQGKNRGTYLGLPYSIVELVPWFSCTAYVSFLSGEHWLGAKTDNGESQLTNLN